MLVVDTGSPGGAWTEAMTMERMRRRRRLRGWFRCCLLHSSQRRVPRPLATPRSPWCFQPSPPQVSRSLSS